jgi:hypothetical protein
MTDTPGGETRDGQNAAGRKSTLLEEQTKEIRKQGIETVARALIWASGALIILAVAGWGLYLRDYFYRQFPQLPANALIAFKDACPDSTWENVAQRDAGAAGAYLRIASPDIPARGGENEHTLTKADIPLLQLFSTLDVGQANPGFWGVSGPQGQAKQYSLSARDSGYSGVALFEFKTLFVGTGTPTPLKIQPKYISIVLCRKKGLGE